MCINVLKEDYKHLDVCKLEDEDSNKSLRYEDNCSIALRYILLCKYVWHNHSLHTSVHLSSFTHKSANYLVAPCCRGHWCIHTYIHAYLHTYVYTDESGQVKEKCTEDQDEMDSQLRIESHSQIEERLQQLIQETRLTKQEQLEQLISMKRDQLQQARSMDLIKQDQLEIKRDIKLEVIIPIMVIFVFIFSYLTKH